MSRIHTTETLFKLIKKHRESGCWNFTGPISEIGYGKVGYKGKVLNVHRLSWILVYGPVINNLFVCHKCDNRKCINPNHLFLGTAKDNTQDMIAKGRQGLGGGAHTLTHCRRGHLFTSENTLFNKNGHKTCRVCHNAREKFYMANKRRKQKQKHL